MAEKEKKIVELAAKLRIGETSPRKARTRTRDSGSTASRSSAVLSATQYSTSAEGLRKCVHGILLASHDRIVEQIMMSDPPSVTNLIEFKSLFKLDHGFASVFS